MTKSHRIRLRVRNISDKVAEKIKAHIYVHYLFSDNCAVCEIMWKNVVQLERPQMTIIRSMWFACWITEVTHTHTQMCDTY